MDQATAIREKELAEFNAEEKDLLQSISALKSAITVLSKHHGALLQMPKGHLEGLAQTMQYQMQKHASLLIEMIEDKLQRIGEAGVKAVDMAEDLEDTKTALAEDKKLLAELEKGCATKEKEWTARCKTRAEELLALSDTIKILNDDDALELFKKTRWRCIARPNSGHFQASH